MFWREEEWKEKKESLISGYDCMSVGVNQEVVYKVGMKNLGTPQPPLRVLWEESQGSRIKM